MTSNFAQMRQRIAEEVSKARAHESPGVWVTYLARDPRRPDMKGNPAGWPIYVGQTDQFGRRVSNHLKKSEKLARKGDGIKSQLKKLLHSGVVPAFEVLDQQPTRLRSLVSETNFARLCRSRGYEIANKRTLQNRAGPPVSASDLPSKWLWEFTLEQGIQDNLRIEVCCSNCRTSFSLELAAFQGLAVPPKYLRDIREYEIWANEPCGSCGEVGCRRARIRVAETS